MVIMKCATAIIIAGILLLGCHKVTPVILDGTLTTCPANNTCTYSYYESADFTGYQPTHGNYRVFWYKSTNHTVCGATTQLYFKTSLSNNNFDIDAGQAAAGLVAYNYNCACCYIASQLKPTGGEVKGKRVDATHWPVNATVILANPQNVPIDTLKVNQYFELTSLPQ